MKGLLQLVIMAALVASFSGNAHKTCVTTKDSNGVEKTTCHHKKTHHRHHIKKDKTCVTTKDMNGNPITKCTKKTVKIN